MGGDGRGNGALLGRGAGPVDDLLDDPSVEALLAEAASIEGFLGDYGAVPLVTSEAWSVELEAVPPGGLHAWPAEGEAVPPRVLQAEDFPPNLTRALSSAPGPALVTAIEWGLSEAAPFGSVPAGSSTAPWAQTMRMVAASRRLAGWGLWCQLTLAARLLAAWRVRPPVVTGVDETGRRVPDDTPDRCEESDPLLTERLQSAVDALAEWAGGRLVPLGKLRVPASQLADELVAAEMTVVAGLAPSEGRAVVEAADAVFLQRRLPRTGAALAAGWLDWPKVKVLVAETAGVEVPVARAVESLVLADVADEEGDPGALGPVDVLADPATPGSGIPVVARWTVPQLRRAVRAAMAELDAAAAARRAEKARRDRHVRVVEDLDGTAELAALLPAEDAAAIFASLTQAAKAAKAAGDPRSLDQLRADELVHRATRGVHPGEYEVPDSHVHEAPDDDVRDVPDDGDATGVPDDGGGMPGDVSGISGAHDTAGNTRSGSAEAADAAAGASAPARCTCGRAVPVAFTQAFAGRPAKGTLVSLTLPLSTFLGLSDQPGRLDGYGPVAAGLARRIAEDAARDHPTFTTWRCVVVDDVHGTVLGVTEPVRTPEHDPPPRLRRLVEAMEPTCVFPGCRLPARGCDLDHRVPFDRGGATCACNLQALCRAHHRLKTTGAVRVRVVDAVEDPTAPVGTLEWLMPSGVRVRRVPTVLDPGPVVVPARARPVDHPAAGSANDGEGVGGASGLPPF